MVRVWIKNRKNNQKRAKFPYFRCSHQYAFADTTAFIYCDLYEPKVMCACEGYEEYCSSSNKPTQPKAEPKTKEEKDKSVYIHQMKIS